MAMNLLARSLRIASRIRESKVTIYDDLSDNPDLIFSRAQIESILNHEIVGVDLNYPLRTRAKKAKGIVCHALGYPIPSSFKKTRPRFPGQNLDVYVQKADNLQIWNEEVASQRRYALLRVNDKQQVVAVRVISGDKLAEFDTTGTLTQKYQAHSRSDVLSSFLVSARDTDELIELIETSDTPNSDTLPPYIGSHFLPIAGIYEILIEFVGYQFPNPGVEQERNRSAIIHELVQKALGGACYVNMGQVPDVPEQLLELKLQTSSTIDLGFARPDSTEVLTRYLNVRYCDLRYAVFYASLDGDHLTIESVIVTTGEDFFSYFRLFEGLQVNKKIQLKLPARFFCHAEK